MKKRRYGALTNRQRFQLVATFVGVQLIAWYFLPGLGARLSAAVLTAAVLLVAAKTRRSTPR